MAKPIRTILRAVLFTLLAVVLLSAGVLALVTLTDLGRTRLDGWVSDAASSPGQRIDIEGIGGIWSGKLHIDRIAVADRNGNWLEIRQVDVTWSPLALLSRRFEARRIGAENVTMLRKPAPAATQSDSSSTSLPVAVDIGTIELPDIDLGEPVLGHPVRLGFTGNAAIARNLDNVTAEGRVERIDDIAGSLVFDVRYQPARGIFDIELQGSEPRGGLVSGLLGLPGNPQVDIAVTGSGSLADWKADGTLSVDGAIVTRLDASQTLDGERRRFTATGEGAFWRLVPDAWRDLIAGSIQFDIAGAIDGGDSLTIDRADLRSDTLTANAAGRLTRAGDNDLRLAVDTIAGPVAIALDGITARARHIEANVTGPASAARIEARADLASLETADATLDTLDVRLTSEGFDLANRTGPFNLALTAASLAAASPALAALNGKPLEVTAAGRLAGDTLALDQSTLTLADARLTGTGTIDLAGRDIAIDLAATVPVALLPPQAKRLGDAPLKIAGKVARNAEGRLSLSGLSLSAAALSLTGNASLDDGTLDASMDGHADDLARLDATLTGAADLTVRLSGPVAAPDFETRLTSSRATIAGRPLDDLALTASGTASATAPAAKIDLAARFAGQPLTAAATVAPQPDGIALSGLEASLAGTRLAGDLLLRADNLPTGTLNLDSPDIAPLASLAGQDIAGKATGTATFTVDVGTPNLRLDLKVPSLARAPVSLETIAADVTVTDYLAAPRARGTVTIGKLDADTVAASDVDLALTWRDGEADVTVNQAGAFLTRLNATYAPADGGLRLNVNGEGNFARYLADPARGLLGESATYTLALQFNDNGSIFIDKADLRSAAATVSATGLFDAAGDSDLKLHFEGREAPVEISYGQFDATITGLDLALAGRLEHMRVDTTAAFRSLVTDHIKLSAVTMQIASSDFDLVARTGPLSLKASAESFRSPLPVVSHLSGQPASLEATGTLYANRADLASAVLSSRETRLGVKGSADLKTGSLALTLDGKVPSAAVAPGLEIVASDYLDLAAKVDRSGEGAIDVTGISASGGVLKLDGSARLADDAVSADIAASLSDLSSLAANATGALDATARLSGTLARPSLDVTASSQEITVAGHRLSDLKLSAAGIADLAAPEADVKLSGAIDDVPLTGSARLGLKDGTRQLGDISLVNGDNRISGDLVLDDAMVPTGTLVLDIPDVAPLAALALQTVKGSLNGNIDFATAGGKPQIDVDLKSKRLEHTAATLNDAAIVATVRDYMAAPSISGTIKAASVVAGGTRLTDLAVRLDRDAGWTAFDAATVAQGFDIAATGRVRPDADGVTVELKSATVAGNGLKSRLARPATIVVAGGTARLDKFTVDVAGGTVTVDGSAGETLSLKVTAEAVPAALANRFQPGLDAGGALSGSATIKGKPASPAVDYDLAWRGASLSQIRDAGFADIDITSTGKLRDQVLDFDLRLVDRSGLAMTGGGRYGLKGNTIDVTIDGRLPFAFLARKLAEQGLSLSGNADVKLTVKGTAAAPQIVGTVSTSGARFVDANTGIALNDLAAQVDIADNVARIAQASGTLSTGGTVRASGTIGIAPDSGFPADLAIRLDKARYIDGRLVATRMSGDLTLKGSLVASPVLGGTIELERTTITIPETLPRTLTELDVKHVNADAKLRRQLDAMRPPPASDSAGGLILDIEINAPRRIFVQGRGLNAELGGDIRLTGPSSAPSAVGAFEMRRGRLSILGKRLDFTSGRLGFSGSIIPDLDLTASSRSGTSTVTVVVTGPANDPSFSFSATPATSQEEALAQLIFGRSLSKLSPLQVVQLADAASQLAGGGGSSLLTRLRNQVGVDDIDIKTDPQTGESAVAVGKYINDRTYVGVQKGSSPESGKATINLDIGRGLKLQGEVNELGEGKAGIFYEKDY